MELYHGDCLEIMKQIPNASVDMILCDLPYGTTACKWDTIIPFEPLWQEYNRITKASAAIVLTAVQPFTSLLVTSNMRDFRQHLVWEKTRPNNVMNAKKMFMKWHEDVLVFYRELPTYNPQKEKVKRYTKVQHKQDRSTGHLGATGEKQGYVHDNGGEAYPKSVLKFSNVCRPHLHPTQKPVEMLEYFIRTYTDDGDTVLDNCMGSGSTGIACIRTGRKFVGIEKDAVHFSTACKRIEKAQEQQQLAF
jgi:site-specific DNA-methyltransferase (adenine-specific)